MPGAAKDQLFLLKPFFSDPQTGPGLFHCPGSSRVEGLLSFYPFLRARLEVVYLDFPRPRSPLPELLGPDQQTCPVLVLSADNQDSAPEVKQSPTGRRFVVGSEAIGPYLARTHGIPAPHP
jgi:hypothetical protein